MRRRNLLLGLGSLLVSTSAFIASGAFGNTDDENDGNWTQTSNIHSGEEGSVHVQAIGDLQADGHYLPDDALDGIQITNSGIIQTDEDGLLEAIEIGSVNAQSTTGIGRTNIDGTAREDAAAFVIANVGGQRDDVDSGRSVAIRVGLYGDDAVASETRIETEGVRFPYTVPQTGQSGNDLLAVNGVEISPTQVICVTIEIDSQNTDSFDEIETIGLTAEDPYQEEEEEMD